MSGPQTVWALWSACDAAGGRRSSVQRDTRGYPVGILSTLVTMCPERVGPRGSLREQVAEAHQGSDQGRGVRVLWQDGPGGAATCASMGMLPIAAQGYVGSEPRPAGPRSAEGLAPL